MKTLKKRILSGAMAGVLAMSLAVPAFAADTTPPKNTTVFTGAYEETDIAVTVPGSIQAFLNPYGLGTSVTKSDDSKVDITGQIVSIPQAITNESGLDLTVGATITGEIVAVEGVEATQLMKFNAVTTKGVGSNPEEEGYVAPATAKSAFVQFQAVQAGSAVAGADADAIADPIIVESAKAATWTAAGVKSVTVGTKAVTEDNLATLKKATLDTDGAFTAYPAGSAVLIRLTGDCVTSPKIGWTDNDSFKVTVAFTFTPVATTAP